MVERETASDRGLTPIDVESLRDTVRARGYGSVDEQLIPGLRAIAVPIFDIQGEAILSATLLSNDAFDRSGDAEARAALQAICRQVTEAIGGVEPKAPT